MRDQESNTQMLCYNIVFIINCSWAKRALMLAEAWALVGSCIGSRAVHQCPLMLAWSRWAWDVSRAASPLFSSCPRRRARSVDRSDDHTDIPLHHSSHITPKDILTWRQEEVPRNSRVVGESSRYELQILEERIIMPLVLPHFRRAFHSHHNLGSEWGSRKPGARHFPIPVEQKAKWMAPSHSGEGKTQQMAPPHFGGAEHPMNGTSPFNVSRRQMNERWSENPSLTNRLQLRIVMASTSPFCWSGESGSWCILILEERK